MAQKNNPVREAVDKVGGVTRASVICEVSNQTVYNWIEAARVKDAKHALLLAAESGIDVNRLAGNE